MKFEGFDRQATPIRVQVGDQEFELLHRLWTASERAEAVEILSRSLSEAVRNSWEYVLGWRGVQDSEGRELPFGDRKFFDGRTVKAIDLIMGQVPWVTQVKTLLVQYALNGVRLPRLRSLALDFTENEAEAKRLVEELEPFLGKPNPLGGASPGGSCTTATSPTGSESPSPTT